MDIPEILKQLCELGGASGGETEAHGTVLELLQKYMPDARADKFGNITGCFGEDTEKPLVLLEAHIDRIGMIVTNIDDDGFLKVSGMGIDRRTLLAQSVTVFCGEKRIRGVISTLPPHVATDSGKAPKIEDIAIDVGMTKEQAEKVVSLGDLVLIDGFFSTLQGTNVCSPATDDRAGVCAVLYALDLLQKEKELPCRLAVLFAAQEEVGCRGSKIGVYDMDPDYAIATDVTFAQSNGVDPSQAGELGKGAMIGVSASLSRKVSQKLIDLAKEKNIPWQIEAMGGTTGTDADSITVSRCGIATGLISIPQRYMHTPCEVVDTEDIKAVGTLMAEFVKSL